MTDAEIKVTNRVAALVVGQIVALVIALTAAGIAYVSLEQRTSTILASRHDSRLDSCYLLRGLIFEAAGPKRHTQVKRFIDSGQLANCRTYATHGKGER